MDQRTRRSPARWLAPLALIAVLVAFAAVVSGSGDEGSSPLLTGTTESTSKPSGQKARKSGTKTAAKRAPAAKKTYVVQVGDTLGGIADKTGVPLERLEQLNPDVDSHLMTAGQKIRLR
jgi:LysM repeat protein